MSKLSLAAIKQFIADNQRQFLPAPSVSPPRGEEFLKIIQRAAAMENLPAAPFAGGKAKIAGTMKATELLAYQIKFNEAALKLELLSKTADALLAVPRRLQGSN